MNNRPFTRAQRYAQELQKILGELFLRELDTSPVGFVTITRVEVSKDLKYAKVYLSALNTEKSHEEVIKFFARRRKFVRKHVGEQVTAKNVPDLKFYFDETFEEAEKMERLFAQLHKTEN